MNKLFLSVVALGATTTILNAQAPCPLTGQCPPCGTTNTFDPMKPGYWAKVKNAELVSELQNGGYVLFFRHGKTDWSQKDLGRNFNDRSKQRNLNKAGKEQAKLIGNALDTLGIPVGEVLASPMFRSRDFAELAFHKPRIESKLLDTKSACSTNFADLQKFLTTAPKKGTNRMLSGHEVCNIKLEEGDCAVVKPLGNGKYDMVARLSPTCWKNLTAVALNAKKAR